LNSLVLSDQQRASATLPAIRRLLDLIPRPNFTDSSGNSRFIGSTTAKVIVDQWTIDISHSLSKRDLLHGYYALQRDDRTSQSWLGTLSLAFGDIRTGFRQLFTFNATHIFSSVLVNEARLGFNRNYVVIGPRAELNPAEFGIANGINRSVGLPQINVAGGLNFRRPCPISHARRYDRRLFRHAKCFARWALDQTRDGIPALF
jgi:hypothetical protein